MLPGRGERCFTKLRRGPGEGFKLKYTNFNLQNVETEGKKLAKPAERKYRTLYYGAFRGYV